MKTYSIPFVTFPAVLFSVSLVGPVSAAQHDRISSAISDEYVEHNRNNVKLDRVALADHFVLGKNSDFHQLREVLDRQGNTHTRYRQTFRGVPVFSAELVVHKDRQGSLQRINGTVVKGISADLPRSEDVVPTVEAVAAMSQAKQMDEQAFNRTGTAHYANEKSELVIYVSDEGKAVLAHYVSFYVESEGRGEPSRPYFLIDARDGTVLRSWEGLAHLEIGTGPGGNIKTGQYEYGTDFGFIDVAQTGTTCEMESLNVVTVDMNHTTFEPPELYPPFSYTCVRNTYQPINDAFSPLNDAHYFGNEVFNMFSQWYNTSPLTFKLRMRVHYATGYDNAFWNGSSMTFGDGSVYFYPLVSLDVTAHEVAHGFTEQNSALIYSNQSGGINEAFSDMTGEAAKFFVRGSNDWKIGRDIWKQSDDGLRYLYNPPLDGVSIAHADDYVAGMGVHFSSGVFNYAFYQIATSPGWDTREAFDVMVHANQSYWVSNSTFLSAAEDVINATRDLGYNVVDVHKAFHCVGLNVVIPEVPDPAGIVCPTLTAEPVAPHSIDKGILNFILN